MCEDKFNCPYCGKAIKTSTEIKEKLALNYDITTNTTEAYPDYELVITFERDDKNE